MKRRFLMAGLLMGLTGGVLGFGPGLGPGPALGPAPASASETFDAERVDFFIPFKEGGGTDVWARALAPHLSAALPGAPTVVVRNLTGGGIGGSNEWQRRMAPTGEMIFGTSGSVQIPFLLKDPRVRYDYATWAPVFATPTGGVVYVPSGMGIEDIAADFAKLNAQELRYGSQGVATLDLVPLLAFELLGLEVEAVFGFTSRSIARQSIQRNEVTIDYQTSPTYLKHVAPLVEAGEMTPLFSWGALGPDGKIGRDPSFPDLPSFPEVYEAVHGTAPSGPGWEAWKAFFTAGFGAQKLVVLPAETDAAVVALYRDAFSAAMADPSVREALRPRLGAYEPITGAAVVDAMRDATTVPPEAEAWVLDWLRDTYNFTQ
ncbi:MAG: tricarboxylate transporter [Pseudomonadota bacterium]